MRAFSESLPMLLLRAHQAVMAEFRPVLRRRGITEQQWRVLRALTTVASMRIGELAEVTLISAPSLTRLLKTLDERGLVTRRTERGDQRATQVAIAPAGLKLIEQVAPHSEARYASIAARLGEREMRALYDVLHALPERLAGEFDGGDERPLTATARARSAKARGAGSSGTGADRRPTRGGRSTGRG